MTKGGRLEKDNPKKWIRLKFWQWFEGLDKVLERWLTEFGFVASKGWKDRCYGLGKRKGEKTYNLELVILRKTPELIFNDGRSYDREKKRSKYKKKFQMSIENRRLEGPWRSHNASRKWYWSADQCRFRCLLGIKK